MCVLCGEFVAQPHWTDRRYEDAVRENRLPVEDYHMERRRDRLRRARLASEILRHYGLEMQDWNGSRYLLRNKKGRAELVRDLGEMWAAAEKLLGRPPDPLDPALLRALRSA